MKWSRLLLLCLTVSGVSCKFRHTEKNEERVAAFLTSTRAASMTIWKDKKIRGISPEDYASLSTALAAPPDETIKFKGAKNGGGVLRFIQKDEDSFIGSAVPITHDGYFLTAAHCAENLTHLQVGVHNLNARFAIAPARVVWKSAGGWKHGPDFALLHAPLEPILPLRIADPDKIKIDSPVLTCGYSGSASAHSGGKILTVSSQENDPSGARWRRVGHSAPAAKGDSGGPVIGPDGYLLAITTSGYWRFAFPFGLEQVWGHQSLAVAPDPAWIQALINKDRAGRKSKRPT